MFAAALRTRFQLPGLSVPYLRVYSSHHRFLLHDLIVCLIIKWPMGFVNRKSA